MPIITLEQTGDADVERGGDFSLFTRTADAELRERGLFIGESLKVIERAMVAGAVPRAMLLPEKLLEDIGNSTNIGAIFRSAAALGVDAVLVTPSCHDPLFRRAARVSMGTVFQVPWTRIGSVQSWAGKGIPLLHDLGFKVAAMALSDESISLADKALRSCEKLAIVLGTEGEGLSQATIDASDYTVKIPMAHDVDSLNAAAASAVAFWELRVR